MRIQVSVPGVRDSRFLAEPDENLARHVDWECRGTLFEILLWVGRVGGVNVTILGPKCFFCTESSGNINCV